jgi:hypothetical protein
MHHGIDYHAFSPHWLEGLGKSFGLPGLAPDANGGCLLMFDDTVITLQQDVAGHQLTVHTEVGHLAPDASKQRLEGLLAANLFWAHTAGAPFRSSPPRGHCCSRGASSSTSSRWPSSRPRWETC